MPKNFTLHDSGKLETWKDKTIDLPNGTQVRGKAFMKDMLAATGCEISVNSLPPGGCAPFYHAHKENEEIYIFLQGQGQMQIDDETFDVGEGSIVRISPAGVRIWRNTSDTAPLLCLVLQVRENSLHQYTAGDGVILEKEIVWPQG